METRSSLEDRRYIPKSFKMLVKITAVYRFVVNSLKHAKYRFGPFRNDSLAHCCHGYMWAAASGIETEQTERTLPSKYAFPQCSISVKGTCEDSVVL